MEFEQLAHTLENDGLRVNVLMKDYNSADILARHYGREATKFILMEGPGSERVDVTPLIERRTMYRNEQKRIGKKIMKFLSEALIDKKAMKELETKEPRSYFKIKDIINDGFNVYDAAERLYEEALHLGVAKKTVKIN